MIGAMINLLPLIHLDKITKSFLGKQPIFSGISMEITRGEFVFLTGVSGAGKSTVFRLIMGLETPDEGRIIFNNLDITQLTENEMTIHRRSIGMVFQDYKLLAKRTAAENIEIPLLIKGYTSLVRENKMRSIAAKMGIDYLMKQPVMSLSGGEQQLVAIARAAVHSPIAIFADEPTANLDQKTATRIVDMLTKLNDEGITIVIATHDINLIRAHDRRVLLIKNAKIHEVV